MKAESKIDTIHGAFKKKWQIKKWMVSVVDEIDKKSQ